MVLGGNSLLGGAGSVAAGRNDLAISDRDPTKPSWGTMLDGAFTSGAVSRGAWGYLLAPGIAIVIVVLAFTWCGNALEKILSPRLQDR